MLITIIVLVAQLISLVRVVKSADKGTMKEIVANSTVLIALYLMTLMYW